VELNSEAAAGRKDEVEVRKEALETASRLSQVLKAQAMVELADKVLLKTLLIVLSPGLTLAEEARNTERHHWGDTGKKLRHTKINFVRACCNYTVVSRKPVRSERC